jgi:UDP-N-acetylglucosamine 2-epimerase (non-hydrolysing)
MIDTLLANLDRFDAPAAAAKHGLNGDYVVATLHRPANVDDPTVARRLVEVLHAMSERAQVIIPVHPRGRANLEAAGLSEHPDLHAIEPLGYIEFISLVRGAVAVVTDSGGLQEETTILGVPCLTLRPNTERPVTITDGTNRLVTTENLLEEFADALAATVDPDRVPPLWDGKAGQRIATVIAEWLVERS